MPELTPAFEEKKGPPVLMDAETYRATLESLLTQGVGLGKVKNVGAFKFLDILIETETSAGELETSQKIVGPTLKKEPAYILLDIDQYQDGHKRGLVVKDTAKNWAGKIIGERDLDKPDYRGPGIWLNKASAVEFDYMPSEPGNRANSEWKPNPEAYRVCLPVSQPVNIPVQWDGGFVVQTGGTLAIRERDVAALAEALQSIREGRATAEEALFSKPGVAKFDIYGMEPGFAEKQYGAVPLKDSTREIAAAFAAPVATQSAPQIRNG